MLRPSYASPFENPRLDPRRPRNPRDGRDGRAWLTFAQLVEAANAGRPARARDLAAELIEQGYGVEPVGLVGYRLLLPQRRTA